MPLLGASLVFLSLSLAGCVDEERRFDGGLPADSGHRGPRDGGAEDAEADAEGAADSATDGAICRELELPVVRVTPEVLVVLDRSNSMYTEGHWDPVREALVEITAEMERRLAFGLMVFPREGGAGECSMTSNECRPPSWVSVPCAPDNASRISSELGGMATCGGTPTAPSLDVAFEYFVDFDSPARVPPATAAGRYVLLATDGAPNCNEGLDGETCRCTGASCPDDGRLCLDDERTFEALDSLAEVGVRVFVLGISASPWRDVLHEMAARGGTSTAYMADHHEQIIGALEAITAELATCEVAFRDPGPVADPELVNFYVGGEQVPRAGAEACDEGWDWADEARRRVRFCGDFCERLREGQVDEVRATFGCPTLF